MMMLRHRKKTPIKVTLPRVVVLVDGSNDVEKGNEFEAGKTKTGRN